MAVVNIKSYGTHFLISILVWVLAGCAGMHDRSALNQSSHMQLNALNDILATLEPNNELEEPIKTRLLAMRKDLYQYASAVFQKGLRLDPANGHLHFLNALAYHRQSFSGDSHMLNLARSGYVTALKFNSSNYMASYVLGQIHMKKTISGRTESICLRTALCPKQPSSAQSHGLGLLLCL